MSAEEVGFEVNEEIVVGDLSAVKEQRSIVPATANVKVRIAKASVQANKAKDMKSLKLELRITDGIETVTDGETELKYKNKPLFTGMMDLVVWADLNAVGKKGKRADNNWWATKQYQIEYVKFLKALGFPLSPSPNVNDAFLESLIGQELLVDIQHEEETAKDANGEYVGTGVYRERLRNFKKAA